MVNKSTTTTHSTRRAIRGTLLSLLVLVAASSASLAVRTAAAELPTALVRLDLQEGADLHGLDDLDLSAYMQLYTSSGEPFWLLPADAKLQAQLIQLGFAPQVLDPDTRGAQYLLLYGLPDDLRRASQHAILLWIEGNQAVARLLPAQEKPLAALRVKSMPLALHPLVIPEPSAQVAPNLPDVITPDPLVQGMIDQVQTSTLYQYVGDLSGEWATTIGGSPFTLATRYTYAEPAISKATRYVKDHLASLGLPTQYHEYFFFGSTKRNVHAEQPGLTQPGSLFLVTAHLDSTSFVNGDPYSYAPGADDNASGSAGVLLVADILSQYQFGCSLRYVLFTGEEQGLIGSYAYAQEAYNTGLNILGVLNLDMIAYNTPNSYPSMELHTRPSNVGDLAIANLFKDVVDAYNLNLYPLILQDGKSFSDHYYFWQRGFPAILAIEDWTDYTPEYHKTTDQLETLNLAYYTDFVKAAVATFAHMGCMLEGDISGVVRDAVSSNPIPGALVEARLDPTSAWSTVSQADGSYDLLLHPGTYTAQAEKAGYTSQTILGIQIAHNQSTPLDFFLQPCSPTASFVFSPLAPQVGETITFSAVAMGEPPLAYEWDFGDGSSGSGAIVTHSYPASSTYSINLTVTNACGTGSAQNVLPVGLEAIFLPWMANSGP